MFNTNVQLVYTLRTFNWYIQYEYTVLIYIKNFHVCIFTRIICSLWYLLLQWSRPKSTGLLVRLLYSVNARTPHARSRSRGLRSATAFSRTSKRPFFLQLLCLSVSVSVSICVSRSLYMQLLQLVFLETSLSVTCAVVRKETRSIQFALYIYNCSMYTRPCINMYINFNHIYILHVQLYIYIYSKL